MLLQHTFIHLDTSSSDKLDVIWHSNNATYIELFYVGGFKNWYFFISSFCAVHFSLSPCLYTANYYFFSSDNWHCKLEHCLFFFKKGFVLLLVHICFLKNRDHNHHWFKRDYSSPPLTGNYNWSCVWWYQHLSWVSKS